MSRFVLLLCGVLSHILMFYSIFDIYFKSPIVHGIKPIPFPTEPPAKRLVLFVADGLRADKLFGVEDGHTHAPYIRSIIETKGVWGVSHTHVPTESRPGHVALIAGFYEDISAVTRGWKENPVEFDSIFNESRFTWSWGSPDILPMFAKGASGSHVFTNTYSQEEEDFANKYASKLDTWVFDSVKSFFAEAEQNTTLKSMLHQDKLILFLHLLGMDIIGHSRKPWSLDYSEALKVVDSGVANIVDVVDKFFEHDEKTAYIFTSDHGMTDWGSHGAADIEETMTPLVAWGAGIQQPMHVSSRNTSLSWASQWKLNHLKQTDIEQADITPLMAALIGLPIPVNSVGLLEVDILKASNHFKAKSLALNAAQIVAQYVKHWQLRQETTLHYFFRPFESLLLPECEARLSLIWEKVSASELRHAMILSHDLIKSALAGIRYFHTYDRRVLSICVLLSFFGWMAFVSTFLMHQSPLQLHRRPIRQHDSRFVLFVALMAAVISIAVISVLVVQTSPALYYGYFLLPVITWTIFLIRFGPIAKEVFQQFHANLLGNIFGMAILTAVVEILVYSFFWRGIMSLGLFVIGLWPLSTPLRKSNMLLVSTWILLSLLLAIFPMLPTVGKQLSYVLVLTSGWLASLTALVVFLKLRTYQKQYLPSKLQDHFDVGILPFFQILLLIMSTINIHIVSEHVQRDQPIPVIVHIFSWFILASSFVLPIFTSQNVFIRLFVIFLALFAPYLLLSIAHEPFYCLGFFFLLFLYLCVEHQLSDQRTYSLWTKTFHDAKLMLEPRKRQSSASDFRQACLFMFFIFLAFFGTGNIASVNSFDPRTVYPFVTVFSPFIMGALLVLKIILPFLGISCVFRAIHFINQGSPSKVILIVFLLSDAMSLHFFLMVRDEGSWLEIGTSISHYVIAMTTTVGIIMLYGVAVFLTETSAKLLPSYMYTKHNKVR